MKLFEILLFLSTLGFLIVAATKKRGRLAAGFRYLTLFLLVMHLFLDGYRWQMLLGYLVLVVALFLYQFPNLDRGLKYGGLAFALIMWLASLSLSFLLPVIQFPRPTGEYTVGLQALFLEDSTRPETISNIEGDKRKLTIKIWYPSNQKVRHPEKYYDEGHSDAFAQSKGMPEFIFSHFSRTKTNHEKNLQVINSGSLPVIVLSHGLMLNTELYNSIIDEIVSHGYIVVGIDHTYETPLSIHGDKKILWSQDHLNGMNSNLDWDRFLQLIDEFKKEDKPQRKLSIMKEMVRALPYSESLDRWSADIAFVIDKLEEFNDSEKSFLFRKINLDQIGILGHSRGGAAAVQHASEDKRVKAAVNMDGDQWGRLIDTTLVTPIMAMYADRNYEDHFMPNFFIYDQVAQGDYYEVIVSSTGHANFSDLSYWSKIHQLTDTGEIDPVRMSEVTNHLILNFFNKYLRQQDLDMLNRFPKEEYPDLKIQKKG